MDSSFIPPPFPFPEAWSRIFVEQQQSQERKWLMPTIFGPAPCQTPAAAERDRLIGQMVPPGLSVQTVEQQSSDDTEGENSGYEYQFVLSDEWRERFRSSIQLQQLKRRQPKREKKKTQKKKVKHLREASSAATANNTSRSLHLDREIQAAKTRALARNWKQRGDVNVSAPTNSIVEGMETSLNMLFDEFCDAFQPVMWPHDPLSH